VNYGLRFLSKRREIFHFPFIIFHLPLKENLRFKQTATAGQYSFESAASPPPVFDDWISTLTRGAASWNLARI
jgi:hypothetical protein